jgi:HPt (histidine-containing phosphotransfer) domain-containing protein
VTVLRQLLELGGPEFTVELYQEFEQEAGELLREAAPLVASGDFEGLLPMLHQLKGTAATLGGTALATQARYLEHQLKEGRTKDAAAGFQLLEHYFVRFVAEYPLAVGPAADTAAS